MKPSVAKFARYLSIRTTGVLSLVALVLLGCGGATEPPAGNRVRLSINAGSGQNFGQGPSVKFWFSGRNPTGTALIGKDVDPEIGTFGSKRGGSGSTSAPWNYWYDARSNRSYAPTVNNAGDDNNTYYSYNVDMGKAESEVEGYLVSFRFVIPENYYYPGTDANFWNGSNSHIGSSMKMAWVTRNGDDTGTGDLVLLSQIGGGNLSSNGNGAQVYSGVTDADMHYFSSLANVSRIDHSNRLLSYLKRPANQVSGSRGQIEWSLASTVTHTYNAGSKIVISNVSTLNHRYIAFTGWLDPTRDDRGTTASSQVLYGDIYVAQGPNARARLEIGDAPTYEGSKWLFIAPPVSWTNNRVTIDFYPDELAKARYWFLTTADGTRYSGALAQ